MLTCEGERLSQDMDFGLGELESVFCGSLFFVCYCVMSEMLSMDRTSLVQYMC